MLENAAIILTVVPLNTLTLAFVPHFVERFCTLFPSDEGLTIDLKNFRKPGEKTFTQRSRLFVGNLPPDITEEEMRKLFEKYGKAGEVFIHKDKGFGFIRLVSGYRWGWGDLVA